MNQSIVKVSDSDHHNIESCGIDFESKVNTLRSDAVAFVQKCNKEVDADKIPTGDYSEDTHGDYVAMAQKEPTKAIELLGACLTKVTAVGKLLGVETMVTEEDHALLKAARNAMVTGLLARTLKSKGFESACKLDTTTPGYTKIANILKTAKDMIKQHDLKAPESLVTAATKFVSRAEGKK